MDFTHLVGAENVERAGRNMKEAAGEMTQAANIIWEAVEKFNQNTFEEWLQRMQEVLRPLQQPEAAVENEAPAKDLGCWPLLLQNAKEIANANLERAEMAEANLKAAKADRLAALDSVAQAELNQIDEFLRDRQPPTTARVDAPTLVKNLLVDFQRAQQTSKAREDVILRVKEALGVGSGGTALKAVRSLLKRSNFQREAIEDLEKTVATLQSKVKEEARQRTIDQNWETNLRQVLGIPVKSISILHTVEKLVQEREDAREAFAGVDIECHNLNRQLESWQKLAEEKAVALEKALAQVEELGTALRDANNQRILMADLCQSQKARIVAIEAAKADNPPEPSFNAMEDRPDVFEGKLARWGRGGWANVAALKIELQAECRRHGETADQLVRVQEREKEWCFNEIWNSGTPVAADDGGEVKTLTFNRAGLKDLIYSR